jgi:multiple sugar transport system permease protein
MTATTSTDTGTTTSPVATPSGRRSGHDRWRVPRLIIFYIVLLLIVAVFIIPYLFALNASFKPLGDILSQMPWVPAKSFSLANYTELFTQYHFATYLENTLLVTVILTAGQVIFSMMGAYAFARLRFPGREALFWVYLSMLMVPNVVTMIPLYVMLDYAHLLNTYWALFLPYALGTPYAVFLMRQFFLTIPQDIIEAARLDGVPEWRMLWTVLVPLSWPIITTATIIAFVFGWNNFLWPLIATNSNNLQVMTVGLANFKSSFGTLWNLILAGSMVALIPLVILFCIFQKQIVNSISLSGVNR